MTTLIARDEFREAVFARDNHCCVICGAPAADAHHILERRLFTDGGYYLDNGVSLCEQHHLVAETTELSCDELRKAAHIATVVLPEHLYRDQDYDKWGNPILPNGLRLPGELFQDQSVQKVLAVVLHLFTNRVKFPRTYHLPWSPGVTDDDRVMTDLSGLENAEVVVTEKMDGENTTFYCDGLHARSLDYGPHPSRGPIKALHARVCCDIPEGWRVCGENVFAKHSIGYSDLDDYFLVFSIWNEKNECLSWDDTLAWAELIGLCVVPQLWRGVYDESVICSLYIGDHEKDREGYVVRVTGSFHYRNYRKCVGKFVRTGHVVTSHHWMRQRLEQNKKSLK